MKTYHRELLRAEIKSTAYHRRQVKARARRLFQVAQKQIDNDKSSYDTLSAADGLRNSKASYARSLNIANGLLKGIPYKQIEAKCHVEPDTIEIFGIIKNYIGYLDSKKWDLDIVKGLLQ